MIVTNVSYAKTYTVRIAVDPYPKVFPIHSMYVWVVTVKLDEDIEKATRDFNYYLRKRQINLDNRKKFKYYDEILITREERLFRLLSKKQKTKNKEK